VCRREGASILSIGTQAGLEPVAAVAKTDTKFSYCKWLGRLFTVEVQDIKSLILIDPLFPLVGRRSPVCYF
jgi:hypothetical protein